MAKLVFDIETSALPLEHFDSAQQEYLFREAEKLADETERALKRSDIAKQFNLWPFTAQVVCIALVNAESSRGKVLYIADEPEDEDESGTVQFIACADEADLLEQFWGFAKHYDSIVTFNGRGFDVPFIYLRSAILNIPVSQKNWLGYRFAVDPHCDLMEQFTFYNISGRDGAARRFNLDFYCKAFGIESPKAQGVSGLDMNQMMAEGRHKEIAEYCLRDVHATVELYKIWRDRLSNLK